MIVGRFYADPLALPPALFFAVMARASRVHQFLNGTTEAEEAERIALSRQLPEDWL